MMVSIAVVVAVVAVMMTMTMAARAEIVTMMTIALPVASVGNSAVILPETVTVILVTIREIAMMTMAVAAVTETMMTIAPLVASAENSAVILLVPIKPSRTLWTRPHALIKRLPSVWVVAVTRQSPILVSILSSKIPKRHSVSAGVVTHSMSRLIPLTQMPPALISKPRGNSAGAVIPPKARAESSN